MPRFRKKPVEIEAVQWTGENASEVADFLGLAEIGNTWPVVSRIGVKTLEGVMTADLGDWIIRGVKGELCPCKPDIFEATYERVSP